MAIDTAEKRRSISGIWFHSIPGVAPNVAKDAEWRQESGRGYSGIAADGPPPPPPPGGFYTGLALNPARLLSRG